MIKFRDSLIRRNILLAFIFLGGLTTLLASLGALSELDLKRTVALSTLRQIGILVMGLGVRNRGVTLFHLLSHAVFKRCLFINVGYIIHQTYRNQDSRSYRPPQISLFCQLQIVVCRICLCGLFFTRGFISKEIIFIVILNYNLKIVILGIINIAIFGTFLYCFRIIFSIIGKRANPIRYIHISQSNFFATIILALARL